MREIDHNNINKLNFKGIQKASNDGTVQPESQPVAPAEQKEIKDLANMPAASLGKSQVASDSIEGDLKFLEKNPELVAKLNQVIDEYAANHSEEETLQMIEKMHQEFVVKK
jgi:hypothetical protein